MRRYFLGMAIASLTVASPIAAQAGDREIADSIVQTLQSRQNSGSLKDFDIDLAVDAGVVTVSGTVANAAQALAVVEASRGTPGVIEIVNEITVRSASPVNPVVAKTQSADSKVKTQSDAASYVAQASGESVLAPANEPPAMHDVAHGVSPADAKITDAILTKLSAIKSEGALRNFELDVSTVRGEVWTRGYVSTPEQKQLVLSTIQHVPGVTKIVDDVNLLTKPGNPIAMASDSHVVSQSSMPVSGFQGAPKPFAPSQLANFQGSMVYDPSCQQGGYAGGGYPSAPMGGQMGGPMPMGGGPSYGAGVSRYDTPQQPNYAWPSYAAYPNYAAVTYPKQYSASAWPYIGPFYPYPQVPLGWRKVALEWDDGLWYLDFSSKNGY